jgi:hypothetical protein
MASFTSNLVNRMTGLIKMKLNLFRIRDYNHEYLELSERFL